jgi:hypothetical protein
LILLAASGLGGCESGAGTSRPAPSATAEPAEAWREVASSESEQAIEALPRLWQEAVGQAPRGRASAELLEPSRALARAAPAPGPYRCSATRLTPAAAAAKRGARAVTQKAGFCFVGVSGDRLSLTAEAPSARFGGYLWETADSKALVFLGGVSAGAGRPPRAYRDDPASDVAGLFQRIGEFRYRLAVPSGPGGGVLVVELLAAPAPT